MTVGENIRVIRKKKRMTLEQVANLTGMSRSTINKYETGAIQNIPSDKIEALSVALNVSPAEIMGWNEQPKTIKDELKFAFFGGADGVTDEMIAEVKRYAEYVMDRENNKNK